MLLRGVSARANDLDTPETRAEGILDAEKESSSVSPPAGRAGHDLLLNFTVGIGFTASAPDVQLAWRCPSVSNRQSRADAASAS
jgi:hypothetical protein